MPLSLPKEREGWKCSGGFVRIALTLRMKDYMALKRWEADPGSLGVLLATCAVLNCSAGFREELHFLCQSSLSWRSCAEEAMLRVAGRAHPAGAKHCPFLAPVVRMEREED